MTGSEAPHHKYVLAQSSQDRHCFLDCGGRVRSDHQCCACSLGGMEMRLGYGEVPRSIALSSFCSSAPNTRVWNGEELLVSTTTEPNLPMCQFISYHLPYLIHFLFLSHSAPLLAPSALLSTPFHTVTFIKVRLRTLLQTPTPSLISQ